MNNLDMYYQAESLDHLLGSLKQNNYIDNLNSSAELKWSASVFIEKIIELSFIDLEKKHKTIRLTISERILKKIHSEHKLVFSETPTLGEIEEARILSKVENSKSFVLNGHNSDSEYAISLSISVARYWENFLNKKNSNDNNTDVFEKFLLKAESFHNSWFESLGYMPKDSLNIYLDEALKKILTIPHKSLSSKAKGAKIPTLSLTPTPIECYKWGQEAERLHFNPRDIFEDDIGSNLVGQIIKYDSRLGQFDNRCFRIRKILQESIVIDPGLIYHAVESIPRLQPQAIAWLICDPSTCSTALCMLETVQIQENWNWFSMDSSARYSKLDLTRTRYWDEAIQVFVSRLRTQEENWESKHQARSIFEVLNFLEDQESVTTRQAFLSPHSKPGISGVKARRDNLLSSLTLPDQKYKTNQLQEPEELLHRLAEPLVFIYFEKLILSIETQEHFENIPIFKIHFLLWLQKQVSRLSWASKDIDKKILQEQIASTVVMAYKNELEREKWKMPSTSKIENYGIVTWLRSPKEILDLDWRPLLKYLNETSDIFTFLSPLDFTYKISLPFPIPDPKDSHQQKSWIEAWARKVRTHLGVLIQNYNMLSTQNDGLIDVESIKKIKHLIEEQILKIVKSFNVDDTKIGKINIFSNDYEMPTFGTDIQILPMLTESSNHFDKSVQTEIIRALSINSSDLSQLVRLIISLENKDLQNEVIKEIDSVNVDAFLNSQNWLTRLEKLAIDSANANLPELTNKVLHYGDKITVNHKYRPRWINMTFKVQLHLYFLANDIEAVKNLPAPAKEHTGITVIDKLPSLTELENYRQFYIALLSLKTNPSDAEKTLSRLFHDDPENLEYRIYLGEAKLLTAKHLKDDEQKKMLKQAYDLLEKTSLKAVSHES